MPAPSTVPATAETDAGLGAEEGARREVEYGAWHEGRRAQPVRDREEDTGRAAGQMLGQPWVSTAAARRRSIDIPPAHSEQEKQLPGGTSGRAVSSPPAWGAASGGPSDCVAGTGTRRA